MTSSEAFLHLKTLKSTPKCHKLTLEVLKVNIFRFKMQKDLIWAYNKKKWQKSHPHHRKKPKIVLCEITGCAQIHEIERPGSVHAPVFFS
jgi:hypothetical protein